MAELDDGTPEPGEAVPHAVPIGKIFQEKYGPSRSTQWSLVERNEIESFVCGDATNSRRFIVLASWFAYVERQQAKEKAVRAKNRGRVGWGGLGRRSAER